MKKLTHAGAVASVVSLGMLSPLALGAEPAVSGPSGSIDLGVGGADAADGEPGAALGRLGGSLALPVGTRWGVQGDLGVENRDRTAGSAGLHFFTRDPDSYRLGLAAGGVISSVATLGAVGPEGEIYLGRFTLGGWAGYSRLDYHATPGLAGRDGGFGMVDASYYPTDGLRLALNLATVPGRQSVGLGGEYQIGQNPASLTLDMRAGSHGERMVIAGIKFRFGSDAKSLIDSDRRGLARDRGMDLFTAAGELMYKPPRYSADHYTNAAACTSVGFTWDGEYCS